MTTDELVVIIQDFWNFDVHRQEPLRSVEAKGVSVQLIRLDNEIIHIIKCNLLRINNRIRELKIESDF